jgi:Asp-tRNA(Asn)/Glu-tRNA(Gln) amidotransferase A subunit family amidase
MGSLSPLWQLTASQASALMQQGRLSSEQYVRACLERIESREPQVQAWAHLDPQACLAQAKACDAQPRRSALHGIPVGLKDVIRSLDQPTRFNSPIYAQHQPNEDAHCMAVLRAKGAVLMGKLQTLEFACGGQFPPTRNPWDLQRTPGGSSSGSGAAVADGMVPLALGTQTGGSTIRPAAFCGAVGMKPTWGRIPFDGIKSFAAHLDTVGLFARSVSDLALLLDAYGLIEPSLPPVPPWPQLKLMVCRTPLWDQAEAPVQAAFDALLERLRSASVQLREMPWPQELAAINTWQDEVMQDGGRSAFLPEMLTAPDLLHADFKAKLANHLQLTPAGMRLALDRIAQARIAFEAAMDDADAVISLSAPGPAPLGLHSQGMATFNRLWTALQVPCISLPLLWSPEGLPMGLQLIHRRYEDHRLIEVARTIEAALPEERHPWN